MLRFPYVKKKNIKMLIWSQGAQCLVSAIQWQVQERDAGRAEEHYRSWGFSDKNNF